MTQTATATKRDVDEIIIRSWPKVIFLYPLMLTSFICGIAQSLTKEGLNSDFAEVGGMIFFVVLCFNFLVISFEFSRFKTLAIFFFFLALFFFLLYLSTRWQVFAFLKDIFQNFHIRLSTTFYVAAGVYFLLIFLGVFINTRFNYWVIRSNEILHKEGFLGDVRRYPSPNLKMTKEISDVFEFLLLGSGRIVLFPATEKQAIVLEHVLRVNASERAIQELLSSLSVEIEGHHHDDDQPENQGIGVGD
jgi:hypothetical protein